MNDTPTQQERDYWLSKFLLEQSETSGDHFMQASARIAQAANAVHECNVQIEKFSRAIATFKALVPKIENAVNAFSLHGLGDTPEARELFEAFEKNKRWLTNER